MKFEGMTALVTGAGSGIGRATALMMAAHGAETILSDRAGRGAATREVADEITALGGKAENLELDVANEESVLSAFDWVYDQYGKLDILVNNAGVQLLKPALDVEFSEFEDVLRVNLSGAFLCCREAARLMRDNHGGAIINVASQHGVVGNLNRAPYCASKAGLINLTRALAIEWAPLLIRVNAVSPTFVLTENNADFLACPPFSDQIRNDLPLGRPATSIEVASAICFLAEKSSAAITGHNLMVDGGWTAR